MRSPYLPLPTWLRLILPSIVLLSFYIAICLVPFSLLCSAIIRFVFGIQPPPRALFEIDSSTFKMMLVDTFGENSTLVSKTESIVEFRKNRFERGLWINVEGVKKDTFLQDVDNATIEEMSEAIRSILGISDSAIDLPEKAIAITTR
jgi:hypothetical protein